MQTRFGGNTVRNGCYFFVKEAEENYPHTFVANNQVSLHPGRQVRRASLKMAANWEPDPRVCAYIYGAVY